MSATGQPAVPLHRALGVTDEELDAAADETEAENEE